VLFPNFCTEKSDFILYSSHLIVPLAPPKLLAFENKNKNLDFYFVFFSLNRTFAEEK